MRRCIVLWLLVACDRSPVSTDADVCALPTPGDDIVQACTQLATTQCERLAACSPTRLRLTWPDIDTCETRNALACELELLATATAATPMTKAACATALSAQSCDAFLADYQPPTACLPPAGTVADGEPCAFSSQCASAFCGRDDVCHREPGENAPCHDTGCGPTMVCLGDFGNEQCHAPVGEGVMCRLYDINTLPCAYGLACVGDGVHHDGYCEPQATTLGEACMFRGCSADLGLTCPSATCVAIEFLTAGTPCDFGPTQCEGGTTCTGTCTFLPADCASCATGVPGQMGPCEYPARCRDFRCELPR